MSDNQHHQDRARRLQVLTACFVIGAAWSALAISLGQPINEPVVPYIVYQLIVGFIAGCSAPRRIWSAWVGTFVGQLFVFVVVGGLAASSTAAIGFVLLPFFCLPTLVDGAVGGMVNAIKQSDGPP